MIINIYLAYQSSLISKNYHFEGGDTISGASTVKEKCVRALVALDFCRSILLKLFHKVVTARSVFVKLVYLNVELKEGLKETASMQVSQLSVP